MGSVKSTRFFLKELRKAAEEAGVFWRKIWDGFVVVEVLLADGEEVFLGFDSSDLVVKAFMMSLNDVV